MRIVVVGAGEVGYSVAQQLVDEGHDVTVVERDEARASKADNELDVMVVRGNGARPQVLEKAGVSEDSPPDFLIACAGDDEANILSCWIARRVGTRRVLGRARSLEFTDSDNWAREFGIDMLISPERSAAREIEELLAVSSAIQTVELAGGRAAVYVFRLTSEASIVDVPLKDARKRYPNLASIIVYVRRGDEGIMPTGSFILRPGDVCYVAAARDQAWQLEGIFGARRPRSLERVLVVGGGKIGYQVARRLERRSRNIDIRLIDPDREKCDRLARELERTIVLCGDGTDRDLLRYEGVAEADGFVTTTASDETNLLAGVLGRSLGAEKSIAVVRRRSVVQMAEHFEVDAVVNPNQSLAAMIMRHVRFPSSSGQLSMIEDIGAEMLDAVMISGSPANGKAVKTLDLPKGIILALVERKDATFVPTGETILREGDRLVLFAASELMPTAVELLGVR